MEIMNTEAVARRPIQVERESGGDEKLAFNLCGLKVPDSDAPVRHVT